MKVKIFVIETNEIFLKNVSILKNVSKFSAWSVHRVFFFMQFI